MGGHIRITDPGVVNGGSVNTDTAKASMPHSGLDLPDIAFGAHTTLAYSENSTAPSLGATEGRYAAALALLGNYIAGSFVAVADGHGGILTTEGQPAQPLLAHPRA